MLFYQGFCFCDLGETENVVSSSYIVSISLYINIFTTENLKWQKFPRLYIVVKKNKSIGNINKKPPTNIISQFEFTS